jgi:hypothetical protein
MLNLSQNAEEKTFLGNLMQTSKNLKEREIIDKNNELKIVRLSCLTKLTRVLRLYVQREFKITQLENQVAMLQSAYERVMYSVPSTGKLTLNPIKALNEYGTMSQWGTPSSPARPADDGDPPVKH